MIESGADQDFWHRVPWTLVFRARDLEEDGRLFEALAVWRAAIRSAPRDAMAWHAAVRILRNLRDD